MKPKLFIGSSTESLNIAYAIQDNLDYDAEVTVWTQGIFKPSSNTLTDLIRALDTFDFGIFVFQPDDYTTMRNSQHQTVRDNVIFELGLFVGRLGRERVFYLIPKGFENLHLPTDLIGVTPGTYDDKRSDNLAAACAPFCNSIRNILKEHIMQNMSEFQSDSIIARKLIMDKPKYWEHRLIAELLKTGLEPIDAKLGKVNKDLLIQRKRTVNHRELYRFMLDTFANYQSLSKQFGNALNELNICMGPDGEHGIPKDIKETANLFISIAQALLDWEEELNSLNIVQNELISIPQLLKGYSQVYMNAILGLPNRIESFIKSYSTTGKGEPITEVVTPHSGLEEATRLFMAYVKNNSISDLF